jgi:hypothetical protein
MAKICEPAPVNAKEETPKRRSLDLGEGDVDVVLSVNGMDEPQAPFRFEGPNLHRFEENDAAPSACGEARTAPGGSVGQQLEMRKRVTSSIDSMPLRGGRDSRRGRRPLFAFAMRRSRPCLRVLHESDVMGRAARHAVSPQAAPKGPSGQRERTSITFFAHRPSESDRIQPDDRTYRAGRRRMHRPFHLRAPSPCLTFETRRPRDRSGEKRRKLPDQDQGDALGQAASLLRLRVSERADRITRRAAVDENLSRGHSARPLASGVDRVELFVPVHPCESLCARAPSSARHDVIAFAFWVPLVLGQVHARLEATAAIHTERW